LFFFPRAEPRIPFKAESSWTFSPKIAIRNQIGL
jgi:hypothetical protein